MITGLFGGMGGCAMIGQSVINVKSGANSRLSTFSLWCCLNIHDYCSWRTCCSNSNANFSRYYGYGFDWYI